MNKNALVIERVKTAFPDIVEEIIEFRDEQTIVISMAKLKAVCQFLKQEEDLKFNFLSDICADDLLPEFPRFAVNYHLYSIPHNIQLRLRVMVEDPDEGPETVASVWSIATWLEMEVWDLMGIRFPGNNSLRRLFLPEDWQGHPLRKDYPLGYEEVQFSFNYEEIDAQKPYAKD